MKNIYYSTDSFTYIKDDRTFFGCIDDIYPIEGFNEVQIPFPTEKKQFYLKNPKTGEFRRFNFWQEVKDHNSLRYLFKSDDDYYVSVLVKVYSNEINITKN
jgi:hypothetical protein